MEMSDLVIDWEGNSGTKYRYWGLDTPSVANSIKAQPGNYVFARKLPNGNFVPLYFGQAESLQSRIPCHDRWDDAVRAGATHVLAHTTQGGLDQRCLEERDLIQKWQPPLNVQHRSMS